MPPLDREMNLSAFDPPRREPVWVGVVVGYRGEIAAVALMPAPPGEATPPTLVTATWATPSFAAGDLGRWLGEQHLAGAGLRALVVEKGPWLDTLGPGGALLWGTVGLLFGLLGGHLMFALPEAAEPELARARQFLPDGTVLQQRALAQALAGRLSVW